jgi:site-specific recombinase XerC
VNQYFARSVTTARALRKPHFGRTESVCLSAEEVCLENRKRTKDLTVMLSNAGAQISSRVVSRRLSEFGFKSRHPLENPKLTPAMRKERLARAHKYKSWTKDDWRKVRHFLWKIHRNISINV